MNEFIEKLIGRLKKYQIEYKSGFGELTDETVFRVMENVIYTINQLAEEYNNESVKGDLISRSLLLDCLSYYISHTDEKSGEHYAYERAKDLIEKQPKYYNDGWIPCSEKKPRMIDAVLVCEKDGFMTVAIRGQAGKFCDTYANVLDDVIAWMPLPEPFKPKGE